jgi:hypothetical protein
MLEAINNVQELEVVPFCTRLAGWPPQPAMIPMREAGKRRSEAFGISRSSDEESKLTFLSALGPVPRY